MSLVVSYCAMRCCSTALNCLNVIGLWLDQSRASIESRAQQRTYPGNDRSNTSRKTASMSSLGSVSTKYASPCRLLFLAESYNGENEQKTILKIFVIFFIIYALVIFSLLIIPIYH